MEDIGELINHLKNVDEGYRLNDEYNSGFDKAVKLTIAYCLKYGYLPENFIKKNG